MKDGAWNTWSCLIAKWIYCIMLKVHRPEWWTSCLSLFLTVKSCSQRFSKNIYLIQFHLFHLSFVRLSVSLRIRLWKMLMLMLLLLLIDTLPDQNEHLQEPWQSLEKLLPLWSLPRGWSQWMLSLSFVVLDVFEVEHNDCPFHLMLRNPFYLFRSWWEIIEMREPLLLSCNVTLSWSGSCISVTA